MSDLRAVLPGAVQTCTSCSPLCPQSCPLRHAQRGVKSKSSKSSAELWTQVVWRTALRDGESRAAPVMAQQMAAYAASVVTQRAEVARLLGTGQGTVLRVELLRTAEATTELRVELLRTAEATVTTELRLELLRTAEATAEATTELR
eukprot:3165795-Amphidinium_carterae.3